MKNNIYSLGLEMLVLCASSDTHQHVQELNRAAAAGKNDRKAREETEHKIKQLMEEAQEFKKQSEEALKEAKKAHDAVVQANIQAARDAEETRARSAMIMAAVQSSGGDYYCEPL